MTLKNYLLFLASLLTATYTGTQFLFKPIKLYGIRLQSEIIPHFPDESSQGVLMADILCLRPTF